ncbi:MAG: hypothetical protein ABIU77_23090 [Ferruginibacter sp.]
MLKPAIFFMLLTISFNGFCQTNIAANTTVINDSTIYTVVDSVAYFPGGMIERNKFVGKNMNPGVGSDNGIKLGKYVVVIKFEVTSEGALINFQKATKFGHGLEDEVMRCLKLSPNWIPAKRNGLNVNSITEFRQLFVFDQM